MANWDYAWQVDGQALSDYCVMVRLPSEFAMPRRGQHVEIPFHHGNRRPSGLHLAGGQFGLETTIRMTNPSGAITHPDGAAGHAYENFGKLKELFTGKGGASPLLRRTAPHQGTVEIPVDLLSQVQSSQNRFTFLWLLSAADPFWSSTSVVNETGPGSFSVGGDAPVNDMIITFNAGGTVGLSGSLHALTGTSGMVVDVGARKVTTGSEADLVPATPEWMEFYPGSVTLTGVSVNVDFYEKWL
jgi:hypothetical protein